MDNLGLIGGSKFIDGFAQHDCHERPGAPICHATYGPNSHQHHITLVCKWEEFIECNLLLIESFGSSFSSIFIHCCMEWSSKLFLLFFFTEQRYIFSHKLLLRVYWELCKLAEIQVTHVTVEEWLVVCNLRWCPWACMLCRGDRERSKEEPKGYLKISKRFEKKLERNIWHILE